MLLARLDALESLSVETKWWIEDIRSSSEVTKLTPLSWSINFGETFATLRWGIPGPSTLANVIHPELSMAHRMKIPADFVLLKA
jgi:hypothetical protein